MLTKAPIFSPALKHTQITSPPPPLNPLHFLLLPGKKKRAFALGENAYKHPIRTREPLFPNDK